MEQVGTPQEIVQDVQIKEGRLRSFLEREELDALVLGRQDNFAWITTGGDNRVISGSVLSGRWARNPVQYLGQYHSQVSVLPEDNERRLLGWATPGTNQHSVFPIYLSRLFGRKLLSFSTSTNGSTRGMVPIATYEAVTPLDILPTQLLRAVLVGDLDTAISLGCLELDEDDVSLFTYACPAKYEYGPVLRTVLDTIEKEG